VFKIIYMLPRGVLERFLGVGTFDAEGVEFPKFRLITLNDGEGQTPIHGGGESQSAREMWS